VITTATAQIGVNRLAACGRKLARSLAHDRHSVALHARMRSGGDDLVREFRGEETEDLIIDGPDQATPQEAEA
jgi:6-phosphogluconate dehydrogenase